MMTANDAFGHWFAGFVDGEGSFNICRSGRGVRFCVFRIALHYDDLPILKEIQNRMGFGMVWVGQPPSQKGKRAAWTVQSKSDCLRLVEILEQFPLRAKKARDFKIWAIAVRAHHQMIWPKGKNSQIENDWSVFDSLRNELCNGRPQRGVKAW